MTTIAVFAEAPLPGQCAKPLLPYNDPEWVARLYAAMLRDTLDGLESIAATSYFVLTDADDEGRRALERHLPIPWTLASIADVDPSAFTILARPDAPAAQIEPLADAVANERAVIGPGVNGDVWLVAAKAPAIVVPTTASAAALHAECTNIVTLPEAIIVDGPAAMEALFEELRRHHERAPRTAIVAMSG